MPGANSNCLDLKQMQNTGPQAEEPKIVKLWVSFPWAGKGVLAEPLD